MAQMTEEQAFQIVSQVCASVQANLQQHQQIQTALQLLKPSAAMKKTEVKVE